MFPGEPVRNGELSTSHTASLLIFYSCEAGPLTIPIFRMRKIWLRKKGAVRNHPAKTWQSQDVNPCLSPDLEPGMFTFLLLLICWIFGSSRRVEIISGFLSCIFTASTVFGKNIVELMKICLPTSLLLNIQKARECPLHS